ncbi:MAG: cation:proton antiporter [Anaerolineales bacterium]|nr:cation:proton antiporter [Anaerolineales bacterium]
MHDHFIELLLILALAFLVPVALARFRRVPVVVGEILAGILLARLGWLHLEEGSLLSLFSDIGLAFLMFLAGLEIDLSRLFSPGSRNGERKRSLSLPLLAGLIYLLTLALGEGGGFLLARSGLEGNPHLLAFILSATSLGVLLPILKERGMLQTRGGQLVFLVALLADFATVLLLTVFIIFQESGLSLDILALVLIFLVFGFVARVGARFVRLDAVRRLMDELSHTTVQLKIRGALAILLGFVVLVESLGAELILGAFLAGMIISLFKTQADEELVEKLEAFGFGFFIPVFFIVTGATLDLAALFATPETLLFIPVIFAISLVVKLVPALLMRPRMGWRETLAAGFLLNTHLSLEVAVAVIGLRLGLISSAASTAVILFAVITVLTMPLLFGFIHPPTRADSRRMRLVFGWDNPSAQAIARELRAHGDRTCFLVRDEREAEQVSADGFEAVYAGEALSLPAEHPCAGVQTFLAFSLNDELNYLASRNSHAAGQEAVIALVNQPGNLARFRDLGVRVFMPNIYQSKIVSLLARNPAMFELLTSSDDMRDVREFPLHGPAYAGRDLRTVRWPEGVLVVSIQRGDQIIIPHGNTRLERNDRLVVMGETEQLDTLEKLLGV